MRDDQWQLSQICRNFSKEGRAIPTQKRSTLSATEIPEEMQNYLSNYIKAAPPKDGAVHFQVLPELHWTEGTRNRVEDIADTRSQNGQSRDHYDGYQNNNQRIFNKTLAFFFAG